MARAARPRASRRSWVPERREVIWIDCNPQAGREMRNVHPLVVLSPRAFNERTSLVIGLPMTTAAYNADNPFAVAVGIVGKGPERKVSYVLCHQPKSFDWRAREAAPHPLGKLREGEFAEACRVLEQIIDIGGQGQPALPSQ